MDQHGGRQPRILLLWLDSSLYHFFSEILSILSMEGFPTTGVRTAAEALGICERRGERCVLLMDNYHLNEQAIIFTKAVFAQPALHARVKVGGVNTLRWEGLPGLNDFLRLPFAIDEFQNLIARLWAELQASE